MKSIAFGNRLARDFNTKSFTELDADARLEILDAINGGLQLLHSLASPDSKITTGSIYIAAPEIVSIGVTQGSAEITGYEFTEDQLYCTIRLDGDGIDNQIVGEDELLHPYAGTTGTVSATIYHDATTVPEPYDEMVGNPRIVETGRELLPFIPALDPRLRRKTGEPRFYCVESNARNQNPPAPSVIRTDSLPSSAYRLSAKFTLAPGMVSFADLLTSDSSTLPLRDEHVETYLLPVCRKILATSDRWKNADSRSAVKDAGEDAARRYELLVPRTLSTPRNIARTKPGF